MNPDLLKHLGPLAALAGTWEGAEGIDIAPSDARDVERNEFRERMSFEPIGAVENHEQVLHGLRYATTAWRLGEDDPFHEEVGYWLWDAGSKQVMRCFIVPRGVAVLAGGTVEPGASSFHLAATLGSTTYGILSNPFLDREFRTVRYELEVTLRSDGSLRYEEDTLLEMPGREEPFHHTDENTLRRVD
jgi:hypothetical protein